MEKETKDEEVLVEARKVARRAREAYLNDFHLTASGEYVYEGQMWEFDGTEEGFRKVKLSIVLTTLIIGAFSLFGGFLPASGALNTFYVLIPYSIELICTFSLSYYEINLFKQELKVRDYTKKKTYNRFKGCGWIIYISSMITLIGDVVYVCINGFEDRVAPTIIYMVLQALIGLSSILLLKFMKDLNYKVIN